MFRNTRVFGRIFYGCAPFRVCSASVRQQCGDHVAVAMDNPQFACMWPRTVFGVVIVRPRVHPCALVRGRIVFVAEFIVLVSKITQTATRVYSYS